jgi:prevent-host-death family protein
MAERNQVTAAEFKAKCLRLMDEVAKHRTSLVITKRGKPIARLVPIEHDEWTGDADNI